MAKVIFDFGASVVTPIFQAKPVTETAVTRRALNQKGKEFRLLRICPGNEEDPVSCTIAIVPLSWRCPPFLALSYCWGDPKVTETITVNGSPMNVTVNLAAALRQLRAFHNSSQKLPYRLAETYLWIDAICINQADVEEKNYQVPLMAKIDSSAARVLIWLGAGNRGSDLFMEWAHELWKPPIISFNPGATFVLKKSSPVDMYWLSLTILLRDWFSRIWTVQESVLAKMDPLVICGSKTVSFAHLANVLRSMNINDGWMGFKPPSQKIRPFLENIRNLENPSQLIKQFSTNQKRLASVIDMRSIPGTPGKSSAGCPNFEEALVRTTYHQATNTRDKIYGVLGLTSEAYRRKIHVNYNLELWKISIDAILANCRYCTFLLVTISQRHKIELELDSPRPSWLPDFSKPTDYDYEFYKLVAMWQDPPRLKITPDNKIITIPATIIDTIHMTKILNFNPYESQEDMKDIERIANIAQSNILGVDHPLYSLRQNLEDKVWMVMTLNSRIKLFEHLPQATSNATCQSLWNSLVQDNTRQKPQRPQDLDALSEWWWTDEGALAIFAKEIQLRTYNLCFMTTSAGILGIGPRELRFGDELVILHGTNTVVALRPRNGAQQHTLLGPVFLKNITEKYEPLEYLYRQGKLEDKIFELV